MKIKMGFNEYREEDEAIIGVLRKLPAKIKL